MSPHRCRRGKPHDPHAVFCRANTKTHVCMGIPARVTADFDTIVVCLGEHV